MREHHLQRRVAHHHPDAAFSEMLRDRLVQHLDGCCIEGDRWLIEQPDRPLYGKQANERELSLLSRRQQTSGEIFEIREVKPLERIIEVRAVATEKVRPELGILARCQ